MINVRRRSALAAAVGIMVGAAIGATSIAAGSESAASCQIQPLREMPRTAEDRHLRECLRIEADPLTGAVPVVEIGSLALANAKDRLVVGWVQGLNDCGTGGCRTGFAIASADGWTCSLEMLSTTVELAVRNDRCAVILDEGDAERERIYYWDGHTVLGPTSPLAFRATVGRGAADEGVLVDADLALAIVRVYQHVSGGGGGDWARVQAWSRTFATVNVGREGDLINVVLLPRGRVLGGAQRFTVNLTTGEVLPGPPSR